MIFHKSREECLMCIVYIMTCCLLLQKVSNGLVFFTRPWFQSGQS